MIAWVVHIGILSAAAFFIGRRQTVLPAWAFFSGLLLKLMAGVILGLIFFYGYGSGDTLLFFEAAGELASLDIQAHFSAVFEGSSGGFSDQPRTLFFVKVLSFILRLTGGSYWIASLYLSFVSFLACWYLVTECSRLYPSLKWVFILCFFFVPTIVFWSSGVLKDTIANGALIFLVAFMLKVINGKKTVGAEWVVTVIAALLLFYLKHYLLIIYLLFTGAIVGVYFFKKHVGVWRWVLSSVILVTAWFSTQFIHPYLKLDRLAQTVYENNQAIIEKTDAEDQLGIVLEGPGWESVIRELPVALYTGLFRPSLTDETPIWGWLHKLENVLLLSLVVLSILILVKTRPGVEWELVVPALFCIGIMAVFLTLSTPNFGTLVRYRNAFMPFLFLIFAVLPYRYIVSGRRED